MLKLLGKLFKSILILLVIAIIAGVAAAAYARYIEPNRITEKNLDVNDPLLSGGMKIAFISDTHFGFDYNANDFRKVVKKINAAGVDLILFGGDLIDELNNYDDDPAVISKLLAEFKATKGKYAVFGNHDYGGGAEREYENIMKSGGFTVLKNKTVTFSSYNLTLTGIDDCLIGYGQPAAVYQCPPDMYNLVLCHEPDIADKITDSNTDIFLSGHSHGGQINLPKLTDQFLVSLGKKIHKRQI